MNSLKTDNTPEFLLKHSLIVQYTYLVINDPCLQRYKYILKHVVVHIVNSPRYPVSIHWDKVVEVQNVEKYSLKSYWREKSLKNKIKYNKEMSCSQNLIH